MSDFTLSNSKHLPAGYRWGQLFRRVDLSLYYPPFLKRILAVKAAAADRGQEYVSEFGYRSWALQAELRAKYLAKKGGKAAPPGYSAHQFGLADDSTADADMKTPGLQPTWELKRYDVLGEELAKEGLAWGASYGDRPHANLQGFTSGAELAPLRKLWASCTPSWPEGLRLLKVWAYLDSLPK